ncbi:hypothetical protein [Paenibacillus cremeus]|uniref:hypothetical protein n=1 Tax=Paenibacillus cremeus TaxID=2163881 RepID=UPI0021BDA7FE|nr:hypothetical protein [Paenibacillus cremeus]
MKAWIYAVIEQRNGCSWHVTLDVRADRDHWSHLYGSTFKLRVLEPSLSFGQACELVRYLKQKRLPPDDKVLDGLAAVTREWGSTEVSAVQWKWWDWKPPAQMEVSELAARGVHSNTELRTLLEGRSLWMDELKSLMLHEGLNEMAEHPSYFLQLAWLQGDVVLESGVHVVRSVRKLPFFKSGQYAAAADVETRTFWIVVVRIRSGMESHGRLVQAAVVLVPIARPA